MKKYKEGWNDALLWALEKIEESPNAKLSYIGHIIEKELEKEPKEEKELPCKLTRLKYAMAMSGDFIQTLMNDYGFKLDEKDSWYSQKMAFINGFAKKHMNSLYLRLRFKGYWPYDDEKEWDELAGPRKDEYVTSIVDNDRMGLRKGDKYRVSKVDTQDGIVYVDNGAFGVLCFNNYDFVDNFVHSTVIEEEDNSQSFFDFNQLKTFDKVLVRNGNSNVWFPAFFHSYRPNIRYSPFYIITGIYPGGTSYSQCVPYEGNEYLMGTIENAKPFYKFEEMH